MNSNSETKSIPTGALKDDASFSTCNQGVIKKNVLVVNSDPQIRESLQNVLRPEGYQVVLAVNGQESIKQSFWYRFDLLVLDIDLPDINGWAVFGMLTSMNPFLQSIVITGDSKNLGPSVLKGAGAWIEKPLNFHLLLETAEKLLMESRDATIQRLTNQRLETSSELPGTSIRSHKMDTAKKIHSSWRKGSR